MVNLSYFININLDFCFLVSIFVGRKIGFCFIESLNLLFIWHIFLRHIPGDKLKKKCPGNCSYSSVEGVNLLYFNNINLEILVFGIHFRGKEDSILVY